MSSLHSPKGKLLSGAQQDIDTLLWQYCSSSLGRVVTDKCTGRLAAHHPRPKESFIQCNFTSANASRQRTTFSDVKHSFKGGMGYRRTEHALITHVGRRRETFLCKLFTLLIQVIHQTHLDGALESQQDMPVQNLF